MRGPFRDNSRKRQVHPGLADEIREVGDNAKRQGKKLSRRGLEHGINRFRQLPDGRYIRVH